MVSSDIPSTRVGAITFLDILGWKGVWTRDSDQPDPIRRLRKLVEFAAARGRSLVAGLDNATLRTEVISDTIVLLSEGSVELTLQIHGELCRQLVCESILARLPVRGATCYGRYVDCDDNIMAGPAVDEAASWHEAADWIGVVLAPSAIFSAGDISSSAWVGDYTVPIKGARFPGLYCVDWPSAWRNKRTEDDLKTALAGMGPLVVDVAAKHLNTLEFYRWCESRNARITLGSTE